MRDLEHIIVHRVGTYVIIRPGVDRSGQIANI